MLWTKQKQGREMAYVDIFKYKNFNKSASEFELVIEYLKSQRLNTSPKTDSMATLYRQHGNELFVKSGELEEAIIKYNKAIFAAELGTENLGMSYANRSACFMQLKKYALCLSDIELAKKNGYPTRLWPKLDERKAKCLKLMQNGDKKEPYRVKAELSFPPDEQIPCFANGIVISRSSNGESHIVTKRNLEIAQTIIIEESYVMVSETPFNYRQCSQCFKTDANLIPCPKCTRVMFCSQDCFNAGHEQFHNIECDINYRFIVWEPSQRLVFRTILTAIRTFGTVEALMVAIELFNNEKKFDESNAAKRKYFKFFASFREIEKLPEEQENLFRSWVLSMEAIIINESLLGPMFNTSKKQRFLEHLILHHIYVVNRNSFKACSLAEHTYKAELGPFNTTVSTCYASVGNKNETLTHALAIEGDQFNASLGTFYGRGIALDGMHMNHSCVPNVARIFVDNKIIYKVIRPIKCGEELFVSYIHPIVLMCSTQNRALRLSIDYPLKCQCFSCKSKMPPYQSNGLSNIDKSLRQLLNLLQGLPKIYVQRSLSVDRPKMVKFERTIIEHLQRSDSVHPTEATLKLQFLLMQIWNNQHAANI